MLLGTEGMKVMPIYEYECTKCGKVTEVWQQMSDKPLKKCQYCSGKVQKLISRSAFHLKGSGWYATDYSGKAASSSSASGKAGTKDGAAKTCARKEDTAAKKSDAAGTASD